MSIRSKTITITFILALSLAFVTMSTLPESSIAGKTTCKTLKKDYKKIARKAKRAEFSLHKIGAKTPAEYKRKQEKLERINVRAQKVLKKAYKHRCNIISWI